MSVKAPTTPGRPAPPAPAPTDQPRWPAGDQASRLRALVDAMSRGTTAEPAPPARPEPPLVEVAPRRPVPIESVPARPAVPIIAIASGKGGVGKTSLAVNLSIALTHMGCRATLLDADLGLANADVLCGIVPTKRLELVVPDDAHPAQSLHDPLFDDAPPARAMADIAVKAPGGFLLVPGSVGVAQMTRLSPAQRRALVTGLASLETRSDLILIDTSAGLGPDVLGFVAAADTTLVVATPEPTSIADAYALIKVSITQAREAGRPEPRLLLVVNQARTRQEARKVHTRLATVAERFLGAPLPLLGSIRFDDRAREAVRARRPFTLGARRSPASKDTRALATLLITHAQAERRGERVKRWRGL